MSERDCTAGTNEFAVKKITPLFWKYSILALAGLILQAASVIADGIFVGNSIGSIGIATIGIISSLWTILVALMSLFGIGGSTIIANKLGEGLVEEARQAYAAITIFMFLFSLVLTFFALANAERILIFLGATKEILPYALDYAVPFFIGMPVTITGASVYYFARAIGKPLASALAYMVPAIIAIVLEYLFLFKLGFGMEASSITWVICVGMAFLLIFYLQFSKDGLKIKASDFKIKFRYVWTAIKIGFAPFVIQLSVILTTVIVNRQITNYGKGELEIAAFATINAYIIYIIMLLCNSLISGLLPIASFNYGMSNYARVRELLKKSTVQSVIGLTALLALVFLFAKPIVAFFVGNDALMIERTISIMKVFLPLYTFGLLALIISGYFQALEMNGSALVSGLSRIVLSTPLLFILPGIFGYNGIWYAQPVSDILAFAISVVMIVRENKRLAKKELDMPAA